MSVKSRCAKSAFVTTPSRSLRRVRERDGEGEEERNTHLIGPKTGFDARTTTAFCTVERVMSCSLTNKSDVLICRLHLPTTASDRPHAKQNTIKEQTHEMPNTVVGFVEGGTRWK